MKKHISFLFLLSLLLIGAGCNKSGTETASGDKVTLELKLKAGDVFKLVTITKQTTEQKVMGMATTTKQDNEMYLKQEVMQVNEKGEATVKVVYERIVSRSENSMTGVMQYDSQKDTADVPAFAASFQPLIGATFEYTVDKQGKVLAVHGIDALMDKIFASANMGIEGEAMKESFKQLFGEEAMTSMMQGMNAIYPTTQVGVGDTWGSENKLGGAMGLIMKNTYKLENIDSDKSVVSFTGEISTDKNSGMNVGGISMSYDLSGTSEGTMEVDRKSGMVLNSKTTQKIKGTVKTMGMSMPMEMDQTTEVKPY